MVASMSESFHKSKEALVESPALAHYDPAKPIHASPYGVGAVISQLKDSGQERPVTFASRLLNKAERNYAQIEREALALILGVRKFHQYLYGRTFTLQTDHKPLMTILGQKTGILTLAVARMQRWPLILSAYSYTIEYRKASENANADALSRLPVKVAEPDMDNETFICSFLEDIPIRAKDIKGSSVVPGIQIHFRRLAQA